MNASPARIDPAETEIGHPTQTARRLVEASVSPNTRRAYAGALRRLDAWRGGRPLHDVTLAAYLAELHDAGRASSSASMAVAAACFRAKLAGQPTPAGERTVRVLAGYRRIAGEETSRAAAAGAPWAIRRFHDARNNGATKREGFATVSREPSMVELNGWTARRLGSGPTPPGTG